MQNVNPLNRFERLKKMLADELAIPDRDAAGIINPKGIDAHHRAAGMRRMLEAINHTTGPDAHNITEV